MRVLKERLLYGLLGAALFAAAAVVFVYLSAWYATVLFAALAFVLTILALRFAASYRAARLIADNPILRVGVASLTKADASKTAETTVNVVVSGFGILMDSKPYQFGQGGVNLTSTVIDRESMTISFGSGEKACCVRLLHGITDKEEIRKLTERLRYETGIVADVFGW